MIFFRSLTSQLRSSSCWIGIIFNVTGVPLEIILNLFGPFGKEFCTVYILIRFTLVCDVTLTFLSITAVKYISVFVLKSPTRQESEFWCFFLTISNLFLAFIAQTVNFLLPGRQNVNFHVCLGTDPGKFNKSDHKINYSIILSIGMSIVGNMIVIVRIKLLRKRFMNNLVQPMPKDTQSSPSLQKIIAKPNWVRIRSVAMYFVTFVPIFFIFGLSNSVAPDCLASYPYFMLTRITQHGNPVFANSIGVWTCFGLSKSLRNAFSREVKELLLSIKENCFSLGV